MIAHVAWRLSRRAAVNLWRAPLLSLVSVLTIGLSLFLGASFILGVFAARALLTSWGAQASVTLYLDRSMRRRPMRRGSRWRSRSAGEATSMCGTSTRPWRCSGSAPI